MSKDFSGWDAFIYQLEASWLEVLELMALCAEENIVDRKLLHYELMTLRDRMNQTRTSKDRAQLAACLSQCQQLLAYYGALRRQTQRADETGSAFSQQALKRLRELKT